MKQFSREQLFFVVSILLQFGVLISLIFFYQSAVLGGIEVILKTEPVDPRDILRGQYIALRYEISSLQPGIFAEGAGEIYTGETIYVQLEKGSDGIFHAVWAGHQKPSSGIFLRGTVQLGLNLGRFPGTISVRYGIESYFVSPDIADDLSRRAAGTLLMRVSVDKNGMGVLRGVSIGGAKLPYTPADAAIAARDARRVSDIEQIRSALEYYYDFKGGKYPQSLDLLLSTYISELPRDPKNGAMYYYARCSDSEYHLAADLEDPANSVFAGDADLTELCSGDSISGKDSGSCIGSEPGRFCYDVHPIRSPIPPDQSKLRAQ